MTTTGYASFVSGAKIATAGAAAVVVVAGRAAVGAARVVVDGAAGWEHPTSKKTTRTHSQPHGSLAAAALSIRNVVGAGPFATRVVGRSSPLATRASISAFDAPETRKTSSLSPVQEWNRRREPPGLELRHFVADEPAPLGLERLGVGKQRGSVPVVTHAQQHQVGRMALGMKRPQLGLVMRRRLVGLEPGRRSAGGGIGIALRR